MEKGAAGESIARDPGWRQVVTGLKVYYWAWIATFVFWAGGTVALVMAEGWNASPRALSPSLAKAVGAVGPLGQKACWIAGLYGLWLCCAGPRRSLGRLHALLALTLATGSLLPSLVIVGACLAEYGSPFLEQLQEAQVIFRLAGITSALFVLGFLGRVNQALGFSRREPRRSLRSLGERGYPGIVGIGAIAVGLSLVLFYLPVGLADWTTGASYSVGWAFWADLSKRLAAVLIFFFFLLRVRDVGLSLQTAFHHPSAGPPPFHFRTHGITLAVLGVFLVTSATEFWLQRCVWTAGNAMALAEAGDFDGAVRTAQRVWSYDPQSRFQVRVQTAVCQVCHDPSFIDSPSRTQERARILGKIAAIQNDSHKTSASSTRSSPR